MHITQLLVFLVYLISLLSMLSLIGVLLIGARTKSRRFIILVATWVIWLLPQFIAQYFLSTRHASDILVRSSFLFAGFVPTALSSFIKERLSIKRSNLFNLLSIISITLALICVTFLHNSIDVEVSRAGIAVTSSLPFYTLLIVSAFSAFIVAVVLIYRAEKVQQRLKESSSALRTLRQALSIGLSINIIGGLLLSKYKSSQVLTPLSMALMTGMIYISIFKHKLFDIRLIVARSLAYIFSLISLGALFAFVTFATTNVIFSNAVLTSGSVRWIYTILAVILAFIFRPLKDFFDNATNKIFYREGYDTQNFLDEFNKVLVSTYELNSLLKSSAEIIERYIKPTYCAFNIRDTDTIPGRVVGTTKLLDIQNSDFEIIKSGDLFTKQKILQTETLDENHKQLRDKLQSKDIFVLSKLSSNSSRNDRGIGYIILGNKKSGNPYSSQDIKVIEIISNELVIAIENSIRFEEIQNFNVTLQDKVDEATRKLRRANEKLKALDESKDDFISMASHQLRTPLTSIKGYISMVLEGDAGKVSPMQHEMLGQAFFSSQRMVYLISDLLNVSRLKTGKFIIERSKVNLATMVAQELDQLKETAAARQLTLTHEAPDDFPDLMLDETKTRQVIMNFVDNAIYYTPAGGHINVKLIDTPTTIELRVIDDGIGVSVSDQHHLFTKFYRAGNARKARPDGTGLGLFMAKKVIIAEEGTLIFESKEGKGSTFGFIFYKSKAGVTK